MKFVFFCHSFVSCWNHGNAHFLRGVARELIRLRHDVTVYEPAHGWSRTNALLDGGEAALAEGAGLVPGVQVQAYREGLLDLDQALDDADVVLVHEWNLPELVAAVGWRRIHGGCFTLLFHDTHHRAITAPHEIERFELDGYDAVLAFGEILSEVYRERGWARQVFTWHEAADTALFRPLWDEPKQSDLIWIGNWGDEERSRELQQFLVEPVKQLGLSAVVHGVRYPEAARRELSRAGIEYRGWLPNHQAPAALAKARATVHIPRRPYVEALRGIPTIRVFEALACGIPLVCSPWWDTEGLFPAGAYLTAKDTEDMSAALPRVLHDAQLRESLVHVGLEAVRARHTCAHRADELLRLVHKLRARPAQVDRSDFVEGVLTR